MPSLSLSLELGFFIELSTHSPSLRVYPVGQLYGGIFLNNLIEKLPFYY